MAEEKKEENKDLKSEEQSSSDQSTEQKDDSKVSEDLKTQESKKEEKQETSPENKEETVDKLLANGTPADKEFVIPKTKYDELAEKSKLYESFAPLLAKLNKNTDMIDKLLEDKQGETLEQKVTRLEEVLKGQKRNEVRSVITDAVSTWSDFQGHWKNIQPIVSGLEQQGISYREAVERAYFAVNPEAMSRGESIRAMQVENRMGIFSPSAGQTKVVHKESKEEGEYEMNDADRELAIKAGIPFELYKKHGKYLKSKQYDQLDEISL